MFKAMLLASISEEAYATVMSDRQDFQIQGVECGLLLNLLFAGGGSMALYHG